MVTLLSSNAVYREFEPKYYYIAICCFPVELAALRSKSKDWWL
jgi:hypothetical protein